MVAQITEGTAFDKHGRPFRRRNPRPAIIVVILLAVATGVIWTIALTRPAKVHEAVVCNPPPQTADSAPAQLGEQVSRQTMMDVTPAKLADTKVRVLNASGRGGQAADVAGALQDLASPNRPPPTTPSTRAPDSTARARSASAPPDRPPRPPCGWWRRAPNCSTTTAPTTRSTSSLGTDFSALAHNDDIDAVLATLRPGATEPSDPTLLAKIHASSC